MKNIRNLLAASAMILAGTGTAFGQSCTTNTSDPGLTEYNCTVPVKIDPADEESATLTRYFHVYEPTSGLQDPAPVVIVLHGGSLDYDQTPANSQYEWHDIARESGILLLVPNGTRATDGSTSSTDNQHWDDCRDDAGDNDVKTNDIGFMNDMLDMAEANFSIDSTRVYAVGASNGGMMAYRVAREMSDRVAAIAASISNNPPSSNDECGAPARPVPVMIMNGTRDRTIPWAGGCTAASGCVESALDTRDDWIVWNLAGTTPDSVASYPNTNLFDGAKVSCNVYAAGVDGADVRFCTVDKGGHSEPSIDHLVGLLYELLLGKQDKDIETAREYWTFLSSKVLP